MRAFSQLSRPVLLLEVLGIALLVAAPLALHERLPWPLSGKPAATALLFAGIALMLPAATVMLWRCAKIIAPALFNARSLRDKPKPGDSHDPDH
ncbi:putative membrane protein [Erwinia sp. Ejp617]|nr:YbjC family protein [Erwinia sp. Ejp617]ADP12090.1 putative membrane protein [Erwinia sp. Ejp617]